MENIITAIFLILNIIEIGSCAEIGDCYKIYLDTLSYNQSKNCKELFDGHLEDYRIAVNEVIDEPDFNQTCMRGILDERNVDKIFLLGLSKQKVNEKDEFNIKRELSVVLRSLFGLCDPEKFLKEFGNIGKSFTTTYELEDEQKCMLKYLTDGKFFNLDTLQTNLDMIEIMSTESCINYTEFFEKRYLQEIGGGDVSFFGMDLPNVNNCIVHSLKSANFFESMYAYSLLKIKINLTSEQQKDAEERGLMIFKSAFKGASECIFCDLNTLNTSYQKNEK